MNGCGRAAAVFIFFSVLSAAAAGAGTEGRDPSAPAALQRFALIVGANDGGRGRERLRYASSDARSIANVLGQLGGVSAKDSTLLFEPSPAALTQALSQLGERIAAAREPGRRIELVFYYSGHSDELGLLLGNERVTYGELRLSIERAAADVTIAILDSCSAGAFTRLKGGIARPPFLVDTSVRVSGHAFLASSSANEAAQESDHIGSSFFTYFLISGLRGAADVSGDGRVTLNEAYNFAFNETLARTEKTMSGAQHPAYDIQLAGTGDIVMTDLRDPSAQLELPRELHGRIYVRGTDGVLAAELTKNSGVRVVLALQPGSYQITVERDGRLYNGQLAIAAGQITPLLPSGLAQVAGERTVLRGGIGGRRLVPVNFAVIPSISINSLFGPRVLNLFSFHLLSGLGASLRGLEIGMASNWRTEDAFGLQFSGGLNVVHEALVGGQLTMGVNIVGGDALGLQFGGMINIVGGNAAGLMISTALNLVGGQSWGFHLSGMDLVRGSFHGAQLSGLASYSGGEMAGMQFSMLLSDSAQVYGVQFAFLNIAGTVYGAQLGIINVAHSVHGAQLGLFNIARVVDGASIGLLSFIQNGTHTLEIYSSDLMPINLGAKLGSRRAYGILAAGIDPFHDVVRWSYGAGFGVHFPLFQNFYLDADLMIHDVHPDIRVFDSNPYYLLNELRLLFGWQILPKLALFAGPTIHVSVTNDPCCQGDVSLFSGAERLWQNGGTLVRLGPGLAAGIRIF
jgi:hypothetical protein